MTTAQWSAREVSRWGCSENYLSSEFVGIPAAFVPALRAQMCAPLTSRLISRPLIQRTQLRGAALSPKVPLTDARTIQRAGSLGTLTRTSVVRPVSPRPTSSS